MLRSHVVSFFQHDDRSPSWVRIAIAIILTGACALAVWHVLLHAYFEYQGPYIADSLLYLAVGRGILNGLTPYTDLLELKPPGIFVLSSLSLWLTGGRGLIAFLEAGIALAIPAIVVALVWPLTKRQPAARKYMLLALAFVVGAIFMQYVMDPGGSFQTDSFGILFSLLYLLVVTRPWKGWVSTLAAAACVACAMGFKEPFIVSIAAAALLLCKTPRDFTQKFIIPATIAVVCGYVLLLVTGLLGPYLEYASQMVLHRVAQKTPLPIRALFIHKLAAHLFAFSPILLAFVTATIAAAVMQVWTSHHRPMARLLHVCRILFAVYLFTAAAGATADFASRHLLFVVPGYLAFFLLTLRFASIWKHGQMLTIILFIFTVGALLFGNVHSPSVYAQRMDEVRAAEFKGKQIAAQIDEILDACGIERYFFFGGHNGMDKPYGFTRHSPIGPLFFQAPSMINVFDESYRTGFTKNLEETLLLVYNEPPAFKHTLLALSVAHYIEMHFLRRPWPCAGQHVGNDTYRILFRAADGPYIPFQSLDEAPEELKERVIFD